MRFLHPIFYFYFMRFFLPLIYLYFFCYPPPEYYGFYIQITIVHTFISIFFLAPVISAFFRIPNGSNRMLIENNYIDKVFLPICVFYAIFVIAYFGGQLPLFSGAGSNAIVEFDNNSKIGNLVLSSLLISQIACVCLFFKTKKIYLKIILFLIGFFIAISAGKKAGLLEYASVIIFACYYYNIKLPNFLLYGVPFMFIILGFFVLQLLRTNVGLSFSDLSLNSIPTLLDGFSIHGLNVIFFSANVYLIQLFEWGGLEYFLDYSKFENAADYFFNPIFKVLGIGGVDKSIGVYLNYNIFDSTFSNGANMTIPLELYAFYGSHGLFISLFPMLILAFVLWKNISFKGTSSILLIFNIISFKFITYIYGDLLNGYKVFLFMIVLIAILIVFSRVVWSYKS